MYPRFWMWVVSRATLGSKPGIGPGATSWLFSSFRQKVSKISTPQHNFSLIINAFYIRFLLLSQTEIEVNHSFNLKENFWLQKLASKLVWLAQLCNKNTSLELKLMTVICIWHVGILKIHIYKNPRDANQQSRPHSKYSLGVFE